METDAHKITVTNCTGGSDGKDSAIKTTYANSDDDSDDDRDDDSDDDSDYYYY